MTSWPGRFAPPPPLRSNLCRTRWHQPTIFPDLYENDIAVLPKRDTRVLPLPRFLLPNLTFIFNLFGLHEAALSHLSEYLVWGPGPLSPQGTLRNWYSAAEMIVSCRLPDVEVSNFPTRSFTDPAWTGPNGTNRQTHFLTTILVEIQTIQGCFSFQYAGTSGASNQSGVWPLLHCAGASRYGIWC